MIITVDFWDFFVGELSLDILNDNVDRGINLKKNVFKKFVLKCMAYSLKL